jgi:SAM-dependent methyltransferase
MKPTDWTWRRYIRTVVGTRLSHLGEKTGSDALIYNQLHFWHYHYMALENAPGVADALIAEFPEANGFADIGAGSGDYAAEFQKRGKRVIACEYGRFGRKLAKRLGVDSRLLGMRNSPPADLPGNFDVAYCFEVIEHIPEEMGQKLIAFLSGLAPIVVFTGAHPGQKGTGHINEQPREH